jgi:hypothetical protein
VSYNPINKGKGEIGEKTAKHTFTSHGYTVKCHNIDDYGCDGIFYGNGVELGCYEVNFWQSNTYFSDDRIESINSNLYNGLEWLDGNYIKHGDKMQYRFHITIGATRSEAQIAEANELGIIYIHFDTLPTEDEIWASIAPQLSYNPHLKFYKVIVTRNNHLCNDRTSMMVLLTPIISTIINNIQEVTSSFSSKIREVNWKIRLKESLLELKSYVKSRFIKFHYENLSEIVMAKKRRLCLR